MLGSSPHTWRILTQYPIEIGDLRIISTYVENTKFRISGIFRHKDHLHIRGEYQSCSSTSIYQLGSSPHTWRIHIDMDKTSGRVRIISTYVENTLKESYDSSILKRCNRPNTLLLPNFKALIFPH